jgi:hypothetical protein
LWNSGELTSTISTTIRRQELPGHVEPVGKKPLITSAAVRAHLLLRQLLVSSRDAWNPSTRRTGPQAQEITSECFGLRAICFRAEVSYKKLEIQAQASDRMLPRIHSCNRPISANHFRGTFDESLLDGQKTRFVLVPEQDSSKPLIYLRPPVSLNWALLELVF